MPLPNILEFIGTNISQRKFQEAQEKLLNYLGIEVPTKSELNSEISKLNNTITPKADKIYVESALSSFQNGALKTYPTLAAADADIANIPLNTKVTVLSATDGGDYYKATAGATSLTKSPYDPFTQAKAYTDQAEASAKQYADANTEQQNFGQEVFKNQYGYNASGNYAEGATYKDWRHTDYIPVKAGDTVKIVTRVANTSFPYLLVYDQNKVRLRFFTVASAQASELTTFTHTFAQDGFFITQHTAGVTGCSIVINEGEQRFVRDRELASKVNALPIFDTKADKQISKVLDNSVEITLGSIGSTGLDQGSTSRARTPAYKLIAGDTIEISRASVDYQYGYNVGKTDKIGISNANFKASLSETITITEENPYIRFLFRRPDAADIDISDLRANIVIKINNKAVYTPQLQQEVAKIENKIKVEADRITVIENQPVDEFNSMFRASSEAVGGVVSFIDDDGLLEVYTVLDPLYKSLNVPYGSAIVPSWINTAGYMSLAQLKELAANQEMFEVLNHTFSHQNMSGLTEAQIHDQVRRTKKWLHDNGFLEDGLVLPYGGDNQLVRKVVAQYYKACYDFSGLHYLTFDTIQNRLIKRSDFGNSATRVADHKALVDNIVAQNGWLVITTHVNNSGYWNSTSAADLTELIDYIRSKGCKILKPRDGFQIFGNFVENDNGFKIAANGKIIGAS